MMRGAIGALVVLCSGGCAIVGPTCVAQQQRGSVATISGQVGAGAVTSHLVRYATEGSQNDAQFSWAGASAPDGPRLRAYATRAGCSDFALPANGNSGECAILASAGWFDGHIASTLIVTHGRGNPERLGNPPEYRIWVVGDDAVATSYSLHITWFFGPDC